MIQWFIVTDALIDNETQVCTFAEMFYLLLCVILNCQHQQLVIVMPRPLREDTLKGHSTQNWPQIF